MSLYSYFCYKGKKNPIYHKSVILKIIRVWIVDLYGHLMIRGQISVTLPRTRPELSTATTCYILSAYAMPIPVFMAINYTKLKF